VPDRSQGRIRSTTRSCPVLLTSFIIDRLSESLLRYMT
jgi:hypothetical protein